MLSHAAANTARRNITTISLKDRGEKKKKKKKIKAKWPVKFLFFFNLHHYYVATSQKKSSIWTISLVTGRMAALSPCASATKAYIKIKMPNFFILWLHCTCSPAFQLALLLAAWHCYKFTPRFWLLKLGTVFESPKFGEKKGSGSDIMHSCLSSTLIALTYAWTLWAFVTACGGLEHSDSVCLAVLIPRQQKFLFIYDNFKGEISLRSRTVGERDTVTSSASDGALENSSQEILTSSHFQRLSWHSLIWLCSSNSGY